MAISFDSAEDLAAAMGRAAEAHHAYEERTGEPDADWAGWYAAFIAQEQASS